MRLSLKNFSNFTKLALAPLKTTSFACYTIAAIIGGLTVAILCLSKTAYGIPYFARKYKTSCNTCHVLPPKLNQQGEAFVARGYRLEGREPIETFPLSVWITGQIEDAPNQDLEGFLSRIELISGGPIKESGLYYFIEWRAMSLGLRSDGTLQDRSGRFEDIFLSYQSGNLTTTVGQFRLLAQEDVSRRLSISEPLAFSTSLPGKVKPGDARLTRLRSFSPSGRSPAIRFSYYRPFTQSATQGWYAGVTIPFGGELSFPLNEEAQQEASFELEGRPKGAFFETYYRSGLNTIGLHGFAGDNQRWLAQLVGAYNRSFFFSTLALGAASQNAKDEIRVSWTNEIVPVQWMSAGIRYDQRKEKGVQSDPIFIPHLNFQFPATELTLILRIEQRFQKNNNRMLAEFSFVF
jgi:hypothetical protein